MGLGWRTSFHPTLFPPLHSWFGSSHLPRRAGTQGLASLSPRTRSGFSLCYFYWVWDCEARWLGPWALEPDRVHVPVETAGHSPSPSLPASHSGLPPALKHAKCSPVSRAVHQLFPLPGNLSPEMPPPQHSNLWLYVRGAFLTFLSWKPPSLGVPLYLVLFQYISPCAVVHVFIWMLP